MQSALLLVAIATLLVISIGDVRSRIIPNSLSIAVAVLGLLRIIIMHDPAAAGYTFMAATAVFAIALLLFWRGVVGGGDAKLIAASVLLIGHRDLLNFLFLMSLCGGALALAILAQDELVPRVKRLWGATMIPSTATGSNATPTRSSVPYGVAIAAAGIITLITKSP